MFTTDPTDKRLGHGVDTEKTPMHDVYLVLSEEERAKGFVRPLRRSYVHVGKTPEYPLVPLTDEQKEKFGDSFVMFEQYPEGSHAIGRYWTQKELDNHGCGTQTHMGLALCETYARDPQFYGSTYCVGCQMHLPVAEFRWSEDDKVVGS